MSGPGSASALYVSREKTSFCSNGATCATTPSNLLKTSADPKLAAASVAAGLNCEKLRITGPAPEQTCTAQPSQAIAVHGRSVRVVEPTFRIAAYRSNA